MASAKKTLIPFISSLGERLFTLEEAETLIRIPNSGWTLKEHDYVNGTFVRRNTKKDNGE